MVYVGVGTLGGLDLVLLLSLTFANYRGGDSGVGSFGLLLCTPRCTSNFSVGKTNKGRDMLVAIEGP